jgi:hypothetical protein
LKAALPLQGDEPKDSDIVSKRSLTHVTQVQWGHKRSVTNLY